MSEKGIDPSLLTLFPYVVGPLQVLDSGGVCKATRASSLATDLSNAKAADPKRGSVAELGCASQSLLDLKLCQSKGSLRNLPKEKDVWHAHSVPVPLIWQSGCSGLRRVLALSLLEQTGILLYCI